jgi:hypothetical protein
MNSRTFAFLAIFGAAAPALAQGTPRSKTTGLMVGFGLNGTSVKFEADDNADNGSGATLQVGYGFTSRFTGLIDVSGVVLDGDPGEGEVSLAQIFALGRFNFGDESKRWRPFVDIGLGVRGLGQKDAQVCTPSGCTTGHDVSFSGGAFAFGGGTSFYATRKLAITGALTWGVGEFSDFTVDNVTTSGFESDARTGRVNIGVTWFPGG